MGQQAPTAVSYSVPCLSRWGGIVKRTHAVASDVLGSDLASSCTGCVTVAQLLKSLCASVSLFIKWVTNTHSVVKIK